MMVQRFAQTIADCGIEYVYCDGYSSSVWHDDPGTRANLHWEQGIAPYAAAVPCIFQLGGPIPEAAHGKVFHCERGDSIALWNKHDGDWNKFYADFADNWHYGSGDRETTLSTPDPET